MFKEPSELMNASHTNPVNISQTSRPRHFAKMNTSGRGSTQALACVLSLVIVLSGCAVGPNYRRPTVNAPVDFRSEQGQAQQASLADLPWWQVFKDEKLQELIQTALKNNYDLRIAVSRVEQSRQIAAEARSQYVPFVNYGTVNSDGKNEFAGTVAPNGGAVRGAFVGAVSAAWEPDVWGRIRRMNEAALAQYLATEEARRGVMLSLVSDVAQAYFELLELYLELDIAKQTTDSFGQSLKFFTQRYEGGVATTLDTSRAAAALATTAAAIPQTELQITIKENQLSVLLGANPGPITGVAKLLDEVVPPEIPVGIPSALLERRPDILQAEQQVRAANAQVGVATANFFPQFGLTALLGRASTPLSTFSSGQTTAWSIAASITGPLFQGGNLTAQKRQAVAAWQQTQLQYQQTALSAFQDVANALISREKFDEILVEQTKAVENYQQSVTVSTQRYVNGKATYYEVLEAQQLLFPAQNAVAQTELDRRVVIVQLYMALGGGWKLSDSQWNNTLPIAPQPPGPPTP
jgi:multidrug efflux system outer membrane protein